MPVLYYRGTDTNWATAGNWKDVTGSDGTPASNDTLIFDRLSGSLYGTGMDQSALTGITLIIYQEFTGAIGSIAASGAPTYLQIGASSIEIGVRSPQGSPTGSPLLLITNGSTACTCRIHDSASTSTDTYRPPIQIKGTNLTVVQTGGKAAIAPRDGETATVTVRLSDSETSIVDPELVLGRGVTRTLIQQAAGTVYDYSDNTATSIVKNGGTYYYRGTGAITAFENYDGDVEYSGTGTCTTMRNGGTVDCSKDSRAKTWTNTEAFDGATFDFRNGNPLSVTLTNGIDLIRCGPQDVTIYQEPHVTVSFAAV